MNVFIVWNSWSILEFMLSIKDYKNYYVYIDQEYNKNNKQIYSIVQKCIKKKIFKRLITFENLLNQEINVLVMKSLIDNFCEYLINEAKYEKIIFLEEGLSDYAKDDFYIPKNIDIYVNNIKDLKYLEYYENVYQIETNQKIINDFLNELSAQSPTSKI